VTVHAGEERRGEERRGEGGVTHAYILAADTNYKNKKINENTLRCSLISLFCAPLAHHHRR
jgi:hypothetical protein